MIHLFKKKSRKIFLTLMVCMLAANTYLLPAVHAVRVRSTTIITVATVYEERYDADFKVEIFIENAAGMAGGSLILTYNPEAALAGEVNRGEVIKGFLYESSLKKAPAGQVTVAWANDTGVSGSGTLLEITFQLLNQGEETAFTISELTLWNDQLNIIKVTKTGDQVGTVLPTRIDVAAEKEWLVSFNTAINPNSVNRRAIYVLNNHTGNRVNTSTSVTADFKSIIIKPLTTYAPGSYTLIITGQIKSATGAMLKNPVRMTFIVD